MGLRISLTLTASHDLAVTRVPGLDLALWSKDRHDPTLLGQVEADARAAVKRLPVVNGSRGTPGLIMSGPTETRFVAGGIVSYGQLTAAMKAVS